MVINYVCLMYSSLSYIFHFYFVLYAFLSFLPFVFNNIINSHFNRIVDQKFQKVNIEDCGWKPSKN